METQTREVFRKAMQSARRGGTGLMKIAQLPETGHKLVDEARTRQMTLLGVALRVQATLSNADKARALAKAEDDADARDALQGGKIADLKVGAHLAAAEAEIAKARQMSGISASVANDATRELASVLETNRLEIIDRLTDDIAAQVDKLRPIADQWNAGATELDRMLELRDQIATWPGHPDGHNSPPFVDFGEYL